MRIERHHGNRIVCGHIYPIHEIKPGSRWQDSSGRIVTVNSTIDDWVQYSGVHQPANEKDSFSFQYRYCLIKDDNEC